MEERNNIEEQEKRLKSSQCVKKKNNGKITKGLHCIPLPKNI
jgi:hypothetical protein